jgi:hypothetical protein
LGALVFKVHEGVTQGSTEIVGRGVEWLPRERIFPLSSVTSGYPPFDDEWNTERFDVPAKLVRRGLVVFSDQVISFTRGDSNADSRFDLSDAVNTLNALFLGRVELDCEDAADANDDGVLNLTDPIYSLGNLFLGGPNPPPPYPEAGSDPSEDSLTCARFSKPPG